MREPNFSFPNQNRAAICITSSIYDRRALDCTDYIPIINTLTNLAYLTGSTPTIRDFITRDGGLERLVTILKNTKVNDRKNGLKWTLAFQCVVNIGVRGTEHIRKRVVQAGMVPVIVNVLESFFTVLKSVSDENERRRQLRRAEASQQNSQAMITDSEPVTDSQPFTTTMSDEPEQMHPTQQLQQENSNNSSSSSLSSSSISAPELAAPSTSASVTTVSLAPSTANLGPEPASTFQNATLYNGTVLDDTHEHSMLPATQEPEHANAQAHAHSMPDNARMLPSEASEGRPQQFFYREDDILHSLQLLAYLSKYPSLRSSFHTDSGSNVFAIVEKFTHRTMHPLEIQYWAGVIMRNACRKDDSRKGIRQCAYTGCGKWETRPREFAKCRRCRKAKYCSKQCQSKAWNEGHRWWCIERRPEAMGVSSSFGTDLPPAPPPPPPPADLQDQPEAAPNLMENGGISSMASGAGGARMIGGGDAGSSTGHHHHRVQQPHQPQNENQGQSQHRHQHQHQHEHPQNPHTSLSSSISNPQEQIPLQGATIACTPLVPLSVPVPVQAPTQPRIRHENQQHLLQRQQLSLPQQPQSSSTPHAALQHRHQPVPVSFAQEQMPTQQQQQQQQQRQRHAQSLQRQQQQHSLPQTRHVPSSSSRLHHIQQGPQRSMTQPHPTTAPIRTSSRAELTPHLGISPDSPTPEQLAQRFVQQAALYPGQHNELAQRLHAQFQQYFPAHHQAEAKRQFSFHLRELFARSQRQQELLRAGGLGSHSLPTSGPTPMTAAGGSSSSAPVSGVVQDVSKQGTPRRRSDLDSDDESPATRRSDFHSTSSLSVPMLTQDLSTTMSLSTVEFSGPLPTSLLESRMPTDASFSASTSGALGSESDAAKAEQAAARDFKVRKLMARDEPSGHAGSSSTEITHPEPAPREDEWSYSRHMAKDSSMDP